MKMALFSEKRDFKLSSLDIDVSHNYPILISLFIKHQFKSYQEKHPQITVLLIVPISNSILLSDGFEDD